MGYLEEYYLNGEKITILLVEDEVIIAMTQKMDLENCGYSVITVNTGEKAVNIILGNTSPIDLILMDINLGSGIDGTQVAEKILSAKDIPVVFLSSHTEPEVVEKTEKISSYGYVVKNSGIVVLDASIKMALRLFEAKTNLKMKENSLQAANDLISTAFDSSLDCFLILSSKRDSEGIIIDFIIDNINSKTEEMLQMKRSDLIGKALCEVLPINRTAGFFNKYKNVVDSGSAIEEEFYLPDTNVPAAWHYHQVVRSGDGVLIIHRNVNSKKQSEKALLESENRFRHFMNHLQGTGWIVDTEFKFTLSQGKGLAQIGLKPDQVIGMTLQEFFGTSDENHIVLSNHRRALMGEEVQYEQTYNNITFETSLSPLFDKDGRVSGVAGLAIDITERKKAEISIYEYSSKFQIAMNAGNMAWWEMDITTGSVVFDKLKTAMIGYASEKFKHYDDFMELVHPDDYDTLMNAMSRHLAGLVDKYEAEYRILHKSGTYKWFYDIGSITKRNSNKEPTQVVGIVIDISDRKLAEAKIKHQLVEKEILLKEVHHRIKNNIASIENFLYMQSTTVGNEEVREALQQTIVRIQSMRILYEKLLIGKDYQEVSIRIYINSLLDSFVAVFPERTDVSIKRKITDFIASSRVAVAMGIIINELLTNVFKYAFRGRDTGLVSIALEKSGNHITLIIQDDGVGIDAGLYAGKSQGFGFSIVSMLAEQLDGTYIMTNDNGMKSVLEFDIQCG
jgi:PAS domain S-box-containing protein